MKLAFKSGRLPDRWMLPTGSYTMNRALGGGLESGRIHVFWGPMASTKSTTALYAVAQAQKMGKTCAYIDAEKTFSGEYAEKCGVDLDSLLVLDQGSNVAEDLLTAVLPLLDKQEIDVIVIDSLSSVLMGSFFEKPESNPMGVYSRSAKFVLAKLLNAMHRDTQIILISHASMDLSGYKPMMTAAMGSAQGHWTSNVIGFKAPNGKDHFRDDKFRRIKWAFNKTKQPVSVFDGEYFFNGLTAEIDTIAELVTEAVLAEVVTKAGAWYKFEDQKFHGDNQLIEAARNDAEFRDKLVKGIEEYDAQYRVAKIVDDSPPMEDEDEA